ncbi:MAG: glutamate--tRNA ligase family protein [Cyclobacteriaceae bacterium]
MVSPYSQVISRLAPTPSGYLHMGNLYNFVLTWLHVRLRGGRLILRIDDLDQARIRDQYLDDIFYALDWLGLEYDDGPADVSEFKARYSQTIRVADYQMTVEQIRTKAQTFYCQCSRKDIERLSPERHYQGTCQQLQLPQIKGSTVLRLATNKMSKITLLEQGELSAEHSIHELMPFPVLIKKDGVSTYQVASLTDDVNMGVNFLVRGKDLWTSSLTQAYLAKLCGYARFEEASFIHHELIEGNNKLKLSKSQNAPLYEKTPKNKSVLISMVGKSMGANGRIESLPALLEAVGVPPL